MPHLFFLILTDCWIKNLSFVVQFSSRRVVFAVLISSRSYTKVFLQLNNFCSVRNNAGYEWSNNISSQFSTLQQKANESFSYLKDLDLMKKGTDVFDVKKNLSISSKGKHFGCVFRVLEDRLDIKTPPFMD